MGIVRRSHLWLCWVEYVRPWLAPLAEWQFAALLIGLALGIVAVHQLPMRATINIGLEEGWQSDPPLLGGWNTAEPYGATAADRSYRWTSSDSQVQLPGVGSHTLVARLHQLAIPPDVPLQEGNFVLHGAGLTVVLPLGPERISHVVLPSSVTQAGTVQFHAPTFTPSDDPRSLGVPINTLSFRSVGQSQSLPPRSLLLPLVLLLIVWSTTRRSCVKRSYAAVGVLSLIVLLLAALSGDRLRFALAGPPLLIGALWGLGLAQTTVWLAMRFGQKLGMEASPQWVRAVALVVFWSMLLRYGGRLYPEAMLGDVNFHVHRTDAVIGGEVFLTSYHQGATVPYPSIAYLLLLPFRLLPINPASLVEWSIAAIETLGILPVAYLTLRGLQAERIALFAALVYALLAPSIMALWWSFLTHIVAQEAVVLLIAVLIGTWGRLDTSRVVLPVVGALCLTLFGHFSVVLNVSLLMCLVLPALWWRFRFVSVRRQVYGLGAAFGTAQLLAFGLCYSAYSALLVAQLGLFGAGGMEAVQQGRSLIPWQELAWGLWRDGVVAHYAVIGLPLALLGGFVLWQRWRDNIVVWLWWATVAVMLLQAAFALVTGATLGTRWLSFGAWAVAVGVAVVLDQVWQRGRWGRALVLVTLLWFGGNTLWLWVSALYRIRPPEPL